jgi:hypothetical protein
MDPLGLQQSEAKETAIEELSRHMPATDSLLPFFTPRLA